MVAQQGWRKANPTRQTKEHTMNKPLPLKEYQQRSLNALCAYFQTCVQLNNADVAFYMTTQQLHGAGVPYQPARDLSGLPYVCLRLPTGGGKTFVAAHVVPIATRDLLHAEQSVVLWLTPSRTIRDQTLIHLRNRQHPYRRALEDALGSITVIEMNEALSVTRSTLDTSTVIIVSTIQASRVADTDERKIYDDNGSLMDHFSGYSAAALAGLEMLDKARPVYSLANVLKLRRPIVIVDEAHNARTELSFATLARFSPSCIIELTATPDTQNNPSNVLYSVSAAELKAEDMIKLPIILHTRANWRELLTDAIAQLDQLEKQAHAERQAGGDYIRPIMLLQAQSHREGNLLTVEKVKETLIADFKIPASQIALATGNYRELDGVDILAADCPLRYIITVQALREGWDCPFAYVLCSVAEMRSSTAVEQILGRVMRLPYARRKQHEALNRAYAFAASDNFSETARSLVDGLVGNGFERLEASQMVQSSQPALDIDYGTLFNRPPTVIIKTTEPIHLAQLPLETAAKIHIDAASGDIMVTGPMNAADKAALQAQMQSEEGKAAVAKAFQQSQTQPDTRSPAERGEIFSIPVLAYKQGSLLEPFEKDHFLERGWRLSQKEASLSEVEYPKQRAETQQMKIDIAPSQRLEISYLEHLHQQMRLLASDRGWTVAELVYWLDRAIPHPDIVPEETGAFLTRLVLNLMEERGFTLEELAHDKYRLRTAVEQKIAAHRQEEHQAAYQEFLLDSSPLVVTPELMFTFDQQRYPYNRLYNGALPFRKHYYPQVGDLKAAGEEFECAQFIDRLPEVKFWVRNPERGSLAFSLQTSNDRFYPDFVCMLQNGRYLVVESKGEHLWSNDDSREKRALGELWAKRSNGTCLFVMSRGKDFNMIREVLSGTGA